MEWLICIYIVVSLFILGLGLFEEPNEFALLISLAIFWPVFLFMLVVKETCQLFWAILRS